MKVDITTYLTDRRTTVEDAMQRSMLSAEGPFKEHIEAMRYSLFAGGKRIRPILCLAAGEAISENQQTRTDLLPLCCALECIHTYSLIHDDLPAMDDDNLRRGKPTNHVLFGEAGAILAGDGLLTFAFQLLADTSDTGFDSARRLQIISLVAAAAGPLGMVGGQALDIASEQTDFPFETLQTIHRNKTGALITCAVQIGAIAAGGNTEQLTALTSYGDNVGLAFQIVDDLLNATATAEQLGKAAGSDARRGKATYPAFFGLEKSRQLALEAARRAESALVDFDDKAEPLRQLAAFICTRGH
ncbi:MAG: polyprenyl synthetase family protein [Desulfopila sp.]